MTWTLRAPARAWTWTMPSSIWMSTRRSPWPVLGASLFAQNPTLLTSIASFGTRTSSGADALALPFEVSSARSKRTARAVHLNTHDYIEYIKRDLMQTIEGENESRKAMMRLAVLLHGDSGTLPNYHWTDTPPELLRSSRHTVLVRFD